MRKLLAAFGVLTGLAFALEPPDSEHISVAGAARVEVMPDLATVGVSVDAVDAEAAKAKAVVDERSGKIIDLARRLGIAGKDVTATEIAISPNLERRDDAYVKQGMTVSREITIVLRDLSKYAELLQGLTEVPISTLGRTQMDTAKREAVEAEALAKAIANAKAKATNIAAQFGAQLGPVYSISPQSGNYSSDEMGFMACDALNRLGAVGGETFSLGPISIAESVHAVFRIKPRK